MFLCNRHAMRERYIPFNTNTNLILQSCLDYVIIPNISKYFSMNATAGIQLWLRHSCLQGISIAIISITACIIYNIKNFNWHGCFSLYNLIIQQEQYSSFSSAALATNWYLANILTSRPIFHSLCKQSILLSPCKYLCDDFHQKWKLKSHVELTSKNDCHNYLICPHWLLVAMFAPSLQNLP